MAHNMMFSPYGSELEIILKHSNGNACQDAINELKGLKVSYVKAYLELVGVDPGVGTFLILPRDLRLDDKLIKDFKRDIKGYFAEYQKIFMLKRLTKKVNLAELLESFASFKDEVKGIDERLSKKLKAEFKDFERWASLYFKHPKMAWYLYRLKNLPRKIKQESYRIYKQVIK